MPRPIKCRRVRQQPCATSFKPAGIRGCELEEVVLTLDEFEALRLADHEGLYQEEAAEKLEVSRQTFGNIVKSARSKVADCLVNGKKLKIEGGVVKCGGRRSRKRCKGESE